MQAIKRTPMKSRRQAKNKTALIKKKLGFKIN